MEQFEGLKIFTLNCWGLRYFSKHRKLRIKLIAQHLSENDYDIVFLQEVWIQSDFEYIRSKTLHRYTFAHMFNNASILGTSGLVIMAKWNPKMIHFHPYSINGTPFRPHHGDWFSTKGVAYVRIEVKGFNLHLFCTHMHAQYDEEEDITDQYSIHRICQSYELAKYINLMACNCSNPSSRDLIVLAGDMNTSSKELPYRLLVELTGLSDCYKYERKKKPESSRLRGRRNSNTLETSSTSANNGNNSNSNNSSKNSSSSNSKMLKPHKSHISRLKYHTCSDESSDDELITCGHKENTFTGANPNPKSSKRIDFILYKLRDKLTNDFFGDCSAAFTTTTTTSADLCSTFSSSSSTSTSAPSSGNSAASAGPPSLSFACRPDPLKITAKDISGLSYSDHQPVAAHLKLVKVVELEVNNSSSSSSSLKEVLAAGGDGGSSSSSGSSQLNHSHSHSESEQVASSKLNKSHHHNNNNNSHLHNKNNNKSKSSGQWTSLGKQSSPTSASSSSNLHGRKPLSPLLHDIEKLLSDFINASSLAKHVLLVAVVLALAAGTLFAVTFALSLTAIEAVLLGIILLIVCLFAFFLRFVTHRHEVNAVKAILNDITKKKSFGTEYGLLGSTAGDH